MPNGALCEPWPGSVSSELAADAGAVAIRVSGEGGANMAPSPHSTQNERHQPGGNELVGWCSSNPMRKTRLTESRESVRSFDER